MKKIAILGAGGFVGKSLTAHLKDKYEVLPITRRNFSLLDGDAVENFIKTEKPDVIINCANEGGARKGGYSEQTDIVANNLRMFFNIERCMTEDMKLINFGSGAQYNKQRDLVNVSEDTLGQVMPQDAYGFSKLVMSKFINGQGKNGKKIFNPIIFGLFGPFEDYTFKFISNACMKNLLGMPIVINQNVRFDYLYIDDFMTIIDKIIECDDMPNREFNITTTESITLTEIVDIINKIGKNKSEVTVRNPGLNYQYTGDNKKLLENMGSDFKFLSYEESIRRLYSYLEANIDNLDTEAILKDEYIKFCRTKEQDKK